LEWSKLALANAKARREWAMKVKNERQMYFEGEDAKNNSTQNNAVAEKAESDAILLASPQADTSIKSPPSKVVAVTGTSPASETAKDKQQRLFQESFHTSLDQFQFRLV
jgi:hypothetical protein